VTIHLEIALASSPDSDTVNAAVAILHDSFAPDEGGGVTSETFMSPTPGRTLITASHDGSMVGFARVDQYETETGLLAWLAVADGARSMGIGRQLIDASTEQLSAAGATCMFVECRIDDYYAPRRRFYERHDLTSASGGDYWLEGHSGSLIQYDLLYLSLNNDTTAEQIAASATLVHTSGAGRRPHRLAAGLEWTLRNADDARCCEHQRTTRVSPKANT